MAGSATEVLEIEQAAEVGRVEAQVQQSAVDPALRRLDPTPGVQRIVVAVEHVEIARVERHQQRHAPGEPRLELEPVQVGMGQP